MKRSLLFAFETFKIVILALAIVIPIRYFLFQPFLVKGYSMEPNFDNGDYLMVDEVSYHFRAPKRGEVIVFHYPRNPSELFIKRIIGLPNETVIIDNDTISIIKPNNKKEILNESNYLPFSDKTFGRVEMKLKSNQYFVLGDNRMNSSDSRIWGPVPRREIIGRVFLRGFPLTNISIFTAPIY